MESQSNSGTAATLPEKEEIPGNGVALPDEGHAAHQVVAPDASAGKEAPEVRQFGHLQRFDSSTSFHFSTGWPFCP